MTARIREAKSRHKTLAVLFDSLVDLYNLERRGIQELNFLVSLYTLYRVNLLTDGESSFLLYIAIGLLIASALGLLGRYILDPYSGTRLNPYLQDCIKADIYNWIAAKCFYEGRPDEAAGYASKAIELLSKWDQIGAKAKRDEKSTSNSP